MIAAQDITPDFRLERSDGQADVLLDTGPRPRRLFQRGSAKAFLIGSDEIVFLNTAGGLAGGDRQAIRLGLGPHSRKTASTQTAERVYRSTGQPARVEVQLEVGAGAHLDWLPQETLLYDGAHLARRTRVDLAPGASCLVAETLVFGREAMGETVQRIVLRDRREVWQGGRPLWIDPVGIGGPALTNPAALDSARAIATLALIGDAAERRLEPLRRLAPPPDVRTGVSLMPGRLILRMMSASALALRRHLLAALRILRKDAPLPRVWQS